MTAKFDFYDVFGVLIPGTLLLAWIAVCFPQIGQPGTAANLPDAFVVVVLTALAVFLGQLLQAGASLLEPFLFKTWSGRPSDLAVGGQLESFLPQDAVDRITEKLRVAAGRDIEGRSLFLYAMQASESATPSRISRFNSLYAYHRGLLALSVIAFVILLLSLFWGGANSWATPGKVVALLLIPLVTVLVWHRTWQRACYYVREVLFTAERVLDQRNFKD